MQEFTKDFEEFLHNKLLIITNANCLECLKKIPVHHSLCSVKYEHSDGLFIAQGLGSCNSEKKNENTCQYHVHSESKFSLTSSYEVDVAFIWKQPEIKGSR